MKRILLLPSASRNPITVWPQSPKITSTPSRSRYSVSRYDAMRVSAFGATRLTAVWVAISMRSVLSGWSWRVIELAEEFGLGGLVFGNRTRHPRHVHVVLEGHVLVGDVAAPDPAPHARRHRHAVGEGAG